MTTLELHRFQTLERELGCRPNLVLNFVVNFFSKEIPVIRIYSAIKSQLNPQKSIISQLFEIRSNLK